MKLGRGEIALLMRSLQRSREKTPERQRAAHRELYGKLSAEYNRRLEAREV